MFKKRKEKKAQQRSAVRNEVRNAFSAALKASEQIEDPAEKIIELNLLKEKIDAQLSTESKEVFKKAKNAGGTAGISTASFGLAATIASIPLTGPVGLVAAGAGMALGFGSFVVDVERQKSAAGKLVAESAGHTEAMNDLQSYIDKILAETVENNVDKISTSPHRDRALEQPGISEMFAAASAKHVAENARLVEEAKKILAAGQTVSKKQTPRLINPNK